MSRLRHVLPGLLVRLSDGGRLRTLARGAMVPLLDQALISASNFLGMVIAARAMPQEEFGLFTIALTGIYAANNIQSALITQPHGVLAAGRDRAAYVRYTTSTGALQLALIAAICGPFAVGALLLGDDRARAIVGASVLAIALWQLQEFARRVLYFERRHRAVLLVDVVSYGGQLIVFAGLALMGRLTVESALVTVGLTCGAAAAAGAWFLRGSLERVLPDRASVGQNLAYGKWLVGAELGSFICMSSYPFLLGAFEGPESAAVLAAANLILNPLNVIWFAIGTAVPIRLARSRAAHGDATADRELRNLYLASAPVVGGYCLFAAVLAEPILALLYGGRYEGFGWVVILAAGFRFLVFHAHLLSVGLRARHRTKDVFVGYAAAVPVALLVGPASVWLWGLRGAMVAMIAAAAVWTGVWARSYRHIQRIGDEVQAEEAEGVADR